MQEYKISSPRYFLILFVCFGFLTAYLTIFSNKDVLVSYLVTYVFLMLVLILVSYVCCKTLFTYFTVIYSTITQHFVFAEHTLE